MKRFFPTLALSASILAFAGCSRAAEEPVAVVDAYPKTVHVTLQPNVAWANTGVKLAAHQRIHIVPDDASRDEAVGHAEADLLAPVPAAGSLGLIAKFGEDGLPVAVGNGIELQANSLEWGKALFVGRNGKLSDFALPQTTDTSGYASEVSKTVLKPIAMSIELTKTDAPAAQAPVDGFFTSNVSPTFDWDDVENAFKYVFELSRYPDFRDQILSLELSTGSSVNLANFSSQNNNNNGGVSIPGQSTPSATLSEGVYYWRVRAQQNTGRTIAPVFKWTDHSPVNWFGIETRVPLQPARVLSPATGSRIAQGTNILLELTAPNDASGLFWRYRGFTGACGTNLDPANSQQIVASPWFVFRDDYQTNFIGETPQRYAATELDNLDAGEYLYEIDLIDGADGRAFSSTRMGVSTLAFSVGCQN